MIRIGILTISDRSYVGKRDDLSGPALARLISDRGWTVSVKDIVPDDKKMISMKLISWVEENCCDIILTTGGTGFSPRDVTPEATSSILDKEAPGLSEAMRTASLSVTPHAMLSRGISGIYKNRLIINLPGSPKAAVENINVVLNVLPHAVQLLTEDQSAEDGHMIEE